MSKDRKLIFQIASVYIGTVVGAGFASGQEMVQFFTVYGVSGMYGLVLTGLIFSLIGWAVLDRVYKYQIKDYQKMIRPMLGNTVTIVMEGIVALFLMISFCAMLAGTGALLNQRFQIPSYAGTLGMAFICFFTFLYDVQGMVVINVILVPVLFLGGILLALYILIFRDITVFAGIGESFRLIRYHWFSSSLLYIGYNSITAIVVLTTLQPYLAHRKIAKKGGIYGGMGLGILGLSLGLVTMIYRGKIEFFEIPLLEIVINYSPWIHWIYFFVILAAMYTTAVSTGYGFANRMSTILSLNPYVSVVLTVATGLLTAQIGFSNIVQKIYPLFGYIGLFEVLVILLYFAKDKRQEMGSKTTTRTLKKARK
mgnify:CR=1 FL=1